MGNLSQFRQQQEAGSLFPLQGQMRIVEIGKPDTIGWDDHVKVLRQLILANEAMYPDIDHWFAKKVIPGLLSSERVAYVAYEGDVAIASAILKLGKKAKFCHLRIREGFQDQDLGQMFFTLMTMEIRHLAEEVHFTLPESLWRQKSGFFKSFGFLTATRASKQYRQGDAELICSAPLPTVLPVVLTKVPNLISKFSVGGHFLGSDLLMSVKPKFAGRFLSGAKVVEIRKKFSKKWVGRRAVLYASKPEAALVGEATVHSITQGSPNDIWTEFESRIAASWEEFKGYTASAADVCAIELSDIRPYRAPVPLDQIEYILREDLTPPQSYCELNVQKNTPWTKAVSVAALLHSRCRIITRSVVAQ